ncbi:hypothetical protein [Embleya sp. NPDC050493]|uniref:hypothetical protein n=1 Tax=Embleya sp. NPDC050493 TaxID=3363989 RepID=UPI0037B1ADBC
MLLLGTPTTFLSAADATSIHHHVLLERNDSVVDSLNSGVHDGHTVVRLDIATDPLPALEGAAAIVDPPWYPADTTHFLIAAATMCLPGARTLLCQPTATTRPGVPEERALPTRTLPDLGFRLVAVEPSAVRYRMPHFEAVSLARTAPAVTVPVDWHTGDLFVLERRDTAPPPRPIHTTTDPALDEIAFGPVRIKLRAAGGPDLGELDDPSTGPRTRTQPDFRTIRRPPRRSPVASVAVSVATRKRASPLHRSLSSSTHPENSILRSFGPSVRRRPRRRPSGTRRRHLAPIRRPRTQVPPRPGTTPPAIPALPTDDIPPEPTG